MKRHKRSRICDDLRREKKVLDPVLESMEARGWAKIVSPRHKVTLDHARIPTERALSYATVNVHGELITGKAWYAPKWAVLLVNNNSSTIVRISLLTRCKADEKLRKMLLTLVKMSPGKEKEVMKAAYRRWVK